MTHYATADDQQKTRKELNKVTAMATDATGRKIVNQTMAEMFALKQMDLVLERRQTGLNYGSLLLAHELAKNNLDMKEIAVRLKGGKDIFQIAGEAGVNGKEVNDRAKKLNSKVEDNLYKHFVNDKADKDRDLADNYDPNFDGVKADNEVSKEELASAQDVYLLWRDRAAKRIDTSLDTADERAAREGHDHVRNGGPQPGQTSQSGPPQ